MTFSRRSLLRLFAFGSAGAIGFRPHPVYTAQKVRVGVLKFGTVSWELDTLKHHGFDAANGIDLEVAYFAGEDATNVAMLAGEIDIIVSDWLWVSRQRTEGSDITLAPYSTAVGAIMVSQESPIKTPRRSQGTEDRCRRRSARQELASHPGLGTARSRDRPHDGNEIVFGAPPLWPKRRCNGELDAVLNFWHFCARLEANGFRRLVGANDAAKALGASATVSALGYVFHEKWANRESGCRHGFCQGIRSRQGHSLPDQTTSGCALHRSFGLKARNWKDCATAIAKGIPRRPVADEEADAAKLYRVLAQIGGEKLVGKSPEMAPGTFWPGLTK